jgi:hypothetical protein
MMNQTELAAWKIHSDKIPSGNRTYLMRACVASNFDAFEALIHDGEDVNAISPYGSTALTDAIEFNRYPDDVKPIGLKIVKLLLEKGVDVNQRGHTFTPLGLAVVYKLPEMMKLLISNGADVNRDAVDGYTPIRLAAANRAGKRIIKILQDAGATDSVSNLQESAGKPTWGAKSPKIIRDDDYEEIAASYQCLEIDRLNQVLKKHGIVDIGVRQKICEEYIFDSGSFLDSGWFRSGDRILWPELCFAERKSMGEGPIQSLHVLSEHFAFHEYAFGDGSWYFEEHNEDVSEIEHGNA